MEEREAVERLKRGDVGGLETLVRVHHTRAVRIADLVVRSRDLAEDVAQDAFVRAYERIGGFDAGRPFAPWFMKIVVNGAVDAANRRERRRGLAAAHAGEDLLAQFEDTATGPEEEAQAAEDRRRVWAALGELSPVQRAAVVQRYYLGMTEAEMAHRDGAPPGTIKSRLHAARCNLSKLLPRRFYAEGVPAPASAVPGRGEGAEGHG